MSYRLMSQEDKRVEKDFYSRLEYFLKFEIDLKGDRLNVDGSTISIENPTIDSHYPETKFSIEYVPGGYSGIKTKAGSQIDIEIYLVSDKYLVLYKYFLDKFSIFKSGKDEKFCEFNIFDVKKLKSIRFSKEDYEIFKDTERFGL